jgi:hypothetical protein
MSELTTNAVVSELLKLSRELGELSKDLDKLELDAVNSREDLTMAVSSAYLSAEGPVETRKHLAITVTHQERLVAETAEAIVRGRKRQLQTLMVRIDVGRSAAAALRAEMGLT